MLQGGKKLGVKSQNSGKEKAHKHKQGGGSPDRVARDRTFMCCVRNPRDINIFIRVPAGRIGDRGVREIDYVPNVYVPFLGYF